MLGGIAQSELAGGIAQSELTTDEWTLPMSDGQSLTDTFTTCFAPVIGAFKTTAALWCSSVTSPLVFGDAPSGRTVC